jgi:hypothetical protein
MSNQRHLWVPDTQIRKGVPTAHIDWLMYYAYERGPTRIILAGDWWDFPSLSSYDKPGSKSAEGRRVSNDIDSGRREMCRMVNFWHHRGWLPEIHFLFGNHENRWHKAVNENPAWLDGLADPFACLAELDIISHPFLKPVTLDGVAYAHFFPNNAKGAITQSKNGAPSARSQVQRLMRSATAGHQQGYDIAVVPTPDGLQRGLIAGSFYLHDEAYIPVNNYWRGMVLKNNVRRGDYAITEVDMSYLEQTYGRIAPRSSRYA